MDELQTLIEKFGTGFAVVLYYRRHDCLPAELSLPFAEWQGIRDDSGDTALNQLALAKMIETASTLDELIVAYDKTGEDNESLVLDKIGTLQLPFTEWSKLFEKFCGELNALALAKMVETASTPDELLVAGGSTSEGSDLEQLILDKIGKLQLSFIEWKKLFVDSYGRLVGDIALAKISEIAPTFTQWTTICENTPGGSELQELALAKMGKFQFSSAEWKEISEISDGKLRQLALAKMSEAV